MVRCQQGVVDNWPSIKRRSHRWSWNTWKLRCWFRSSFLRPSGLKLPRLKPGLRNVAESAQKFTRQDWSKSLKWIVRDLSAFVRFCLRSWKRDDFVRGKDLSAELKGMGFTRDTSAQESAFNGKKHISHLDSPRSCPQCCYLSKTWSSICPRLPDKISSILHSRLLRFKTKRIEICCSYFSWGVRVLDSSRVALTVVDPKDLNKSMCVMYWNRERRWQHAAAAVLKKCSKDHFHANLTFQANHIKKS